VLASDPHFNLWEAGFSPDGRWIVFNAVSVDNPGMATISVIPAAGADRSHWTAVRALGDWADKPRWSPDGTHIYFTMLRDGFWNLWGVRFDPASGTPADAPFQITHFDSASRQISPNYLGAEVGIGGGRLVLPIVEQTGAIWMLDGVDH
jgi:Tol biopolymer transport system component